MNKYSVVLLCAGKGERTGLSYNKVLYKIHGNKEIYRYSLDLFLSDESCEKIVIVSSENDYSTFKEIENERITVVLGGKERGDSVRLGLEKIDSEIALIHDAARPILTIDDIKALVDGAFESGAMVLANPCFNTVSMVEDFKIESYVDRKKAVLIATPQAFKTSLIKDAYQKAFSENLYFTDDTSVYKKYIGDVKIYLSNNLSIKATTLSDIEMLERIL